MLRPVESLEILGDAFWERFMDGTSVEVATWSGRSGIQEETVSHWVQQTLVAFGDRWSPPNSEEIEFLYITFIWYVHGYIDSKVSSFE